MSQSLKAEGRHNVNQHKKLDHGCAFNVGEWVANITRVRISEKECSSPINEVWRMTLCSGASQQTEPLNLHSPM
jgi:hypothetical protein